MSYLQEHTAKINILGIYLDDLSDAKIADRVRGWLKLSGTHTVVTPNPEFVLLASRRPEWIQVINTSELSLPDGVGIQFASVALTGERIVHRQTGTDGVEKILAVLSERGGGRVLLVGDDEHGMYGKGALSRAQEILAKRFPVLTFEAIDPGRLDGGLYPQALIDTAMHMSAIAVFVALPMAYQIDAMRAHAEAGYDGIVMGIGGGLDMIAGTSKRAPKLWRKFGFEWLWRFLREPARYKRMYRALIVFPLTIAYATWRRGHFLKSAFRVFKYLFTGTYVGN